MTHARMLCAAIDKRCSDRYKTVGAAMDKRCSDRYNKTVGTAVVTDTKLLGQH